MTRIQMATALEDLILRLANRSDIETPPPNLQLHEWSYVLGIASYAIVRLRDSLITENRP